MTADAIRSRLDSQAPAVKITMNEPPWEPLAASSHGMPVNPWPPEQTFHFPAQQEGQYRIALQQMLVVQNASDRRIQVRFDGDLLIVDENKRPVAAEVMLLEPEGESPQVFLQKEFTIKELSENYLAKQAGQALAHKVLGTITVEDDRDNGSTDRWDLVLTGCPIVPVPDRDGLWHVARYNIVEGSGLRTLEYSLLPSRQRIHWISRAKGIQLNAPSGD